MSDVRFKPIARGPQVGAPPSLEFVAVERLQVDPAYQRATDGPHSRRIIVGMVRKWEWPLCQPLVVARRADGSLWILDGQHRHAGATERGDIAHLPCVVLAGIDGDGEARAFVDLNTRRQRLSQSDIFNAQLAASDPAAKETAALLTETGWRQVRNNNPQAWQPGDLQCAPRIAKLVAANGAGPVRTALRVLRDAYPGEPVRAAANVITALVTIFRARSAHALEPAAVARGMGRFSPDSWQPRALHRRRVNTRLSINDAMVELIAEAASPKLRAGGPAAFDAEGKAWCEQCEQRVSRDRATACQSQFCKLKARG